MGKGPIQWMKDIDLEMKGWLWTKHALSLVLVALLLVALLTVLHDRSPVDSAHVHGALVERQRVLCWVMTTPKNHQTKAKAVKETWGPRCDILQFMSSELEPSLPTVALPVEEGRAQLWNKTREAFRYLHERGYLAQVDWVLKADDDTYVVVENLRALLSEHDPSAPLYLGLHFKGFSDRGFMSGGAGYVLSRRAAQLFATRVPSGDCSKATKAEDTSMGRCMVAVNATFVDTRDADGKQRFYAYSPERHVNPDKAMEWLKGYMHDPVPAGPQCCSSTPVSFHYISPSLMHTLDYLLYRVKVLGLDST